MTNNNLILNKTILLTIKIIPQNQIRLYYEETPRKCNFQEINEK